MPLSERQLAAFADKHARQIPFDTSPRHLAGPGDPRHVTHGLAAAGWSTLSDPLGAEVDLRSPDHRYRMECTPHAGTSAWWTLWAKSTDTEPGWFAQFGDFVPAEVLAGLTDALIAPEPAKPPGVMPILESAGWRIGQQNTAVSPDAMCHVEQCTDPEIYDTPYWHIETCEPGNERYMGAQLWYAWFNNHAPEHLVAAFVTALADPAPLQRAMYDRTAHHSVVQRRSPLTPEQTVEAHANRVRSLRAQARSARRKQTKPAAGSGEARHRTAGRPAMNRLDPSISTDHRAHRALLRHLDDFLSDSETILDAWDVYSDEHTDLDGWPHDDHAYGVRASRRDADAYGAFEPLRAGARHLLAAAETQLAHLPADTVQSRWHYQLGVLRAALDRLDELHEQWVETRDSLPATAGPGTPAFDDALAEYHAESWSYLDDWATHGHALREINTTARNAPSPRSAPPTAAPLPGRRSPARK